MVEGFDIDDINKSLPHEDAIDTRNVSVLEGLDSNLDRYHDGRTLLILKILSSNTLPKDTELKIARRGLKHGLRRAKDSITYFGCKKYDKNR